MDWKIELIFIPVTDVDRAKSFYVDRVGFHADFDSQVSEKLRFVQLTPPGSACSIAFGTGITDMAPGSQRGVQVVVPDADLAFRHLRDHARGQAEQHGGRGGAGFQEIASADGFGPNGHSWRRMIVHLLVILPRIFCSLFSIARAVLL